MARASDISAAMAAAMAVGIMRATFEATLTFTKTETRGGTVPILAHQSVANILVDVKMCTEASRSLTWRAACVFEEEERAYKDRRELVLEAKMFSSNCAVRCLADAMKAVGM
jgi:alkylation response protein AidB-like acyl-CoA dehydrogenase